MMRSWLLVPMAWLSGCGSVECGAGFVSGAEGACVPAFTYADACADGQLRDGTGACRAPEGVEVDERDPDDETETEEPEETGDTKEPEETGDTEEPSDLTCDYEIAFFTGSYAAECSWGIYDGETPLLTFGYGSFGDNNTLFETTVTVTDGVTYLVQMYDSYSDSWNGASLTIYPPGSDAPAAEGSVPAGFNSMTFTAECPPIRR